jgi:hypothetical protein
VTPIVSASLVAEVLGVFERHGLHYRDGNQARRAAGLIREAAMAYYSPREIRARTPVSGIVLAAPQLDLLAEMCQDACATTGRGWTD